MEVEEEKGQSFCVLEKTTASDFEDFEISVEDEAGKEVQHEPEI